MFQHASVSGVAVIGNNLEVGIDVTFDSKISVGYHSTDKAQIQALVAISKYCYQSFMYECRNTKVNALPVRNIYINILPIGKRLSPCISKFERTPSTHTSISWCI